VSLDGTSVKLPPQPALLLAMVLHELATNAAKYGGLSVPAGRVSIRWRLVPAAEGEGIEIVWMESGGPPVKEPERRGFGSLVIERNLARSLDGDVQLEFPPDGARCRMLIPATNLAAGR
jgi:two-component sensor histidine kinase